MSEKTKDITARISLRPIIPGDEDFLKDLYFSTREDLKMLPLDEPQKHAFITMQYNSQKQHYQVQFPDATHEAVLYDGVPVGRLFLDHGPDRMYLVDISMLAEYRGMGIGTAIMNDLVEEAAKEGAALSLHVMKTNPAARLYL